MAIEDPDGAAQPAPSDDAPPDDDAAGLTDDQDDAPPQPEAAADLDPTEAHFAHQRQLMAWIKMPNIAKDLDEELLNEIGQDVIRDYKIDETSRAEWKDRTKKAMEFAMQVTQAKTFPWPGAANVIFPLMTTAAMQFAARAYPAIVSGDDVVKGVVVGDDRGVPQITTGPNGAPAPAIDPQTQQPVWKVAPGAKKERAERIGDHMSWQLLDEQPEWEGDTDKLLHILPIIGCVFRKSYFDPAKGRNVSLMVSALDLCINYKAKSIEIAPRLTEHVPMYPIEIEEKVRAGLFLEHDYGLPPDTDGDEDAPHVFLEQHRRWDLDKDGYAEPYIVTVHKETSQVARIRAGYDEDTVHFRNKLMPERLFSLATLSHPGAAQKLPQEAFGDMRLGKIDPVQYYTQYDFLPSMDGGIYGTGFGNILRPINASINATLNQMLDAGTLANTGGGFIGKGLSMSTGAVRFQVGEYKPINVAGGTIRDNLVTVPFPGPSPVLFQLLGLLIEAGKEIAAIKDILAGDVNGQNMQPTTVLALIEQGLKVFVAIYKRVYRSLKKEYGKLYRLNRLYMPVEGVHFQRGDAQFHVTQADYADDMMVAPVSDPRMVSDMQKMGRAAFILAFKDDPHFNPLAIRKRVFDMAQIDRPDELILPQAPPNPVLITKIIEYHQKGAELEQKAAQLKADASREKAAEVKDLALGVLALAQAAKADGDGRLDVLEHKLEVYRMHLEQANRILDANAPQESAAASADAQQGAGAPAAPGTPQGAPAAPAGPPAPQSLAGPGEMPPVHGALKAPDGHWYLPPAAPGGQYLHVRPM